VLDATGTEVAQGWAELLAARRHPEMCGLPIEGSRLKRALERGGIPADLRAEVWLTFSGAGARMRLHSGVYEQLCERVAIYHDCAAPFVSSSSCSSPTGPSTGGSSGSHSEQLAHRVFEQVEKDLRRTEVGSDGIKLGAMRRVLCAYASHKPEVGYVQGMNFIVAALLDVFDEPAAFWMLALIVEAWLPEHFSAAMVGNHIDCRVLAILTAEHLPELAKRLHDLDVTVQLLTTRWFLCLWSSVLRTESLHRLWDFLFVSGPAATLQAALACMHLCEARVLQTRDIGEALSAVKEVLRDDDGELLEVTLHRVSDISLEQLAAWRMHCRDIVVSETRHLQATRRLLKLQRASGFSLQELKLMARLCGPSDGTAHADALLTLRIDVDGFLRVLRGLVPQWRHLLLRRTPLAAAGAPTAHGAFGATALPGRMPLPLSACTTCTTGDIAAGVEDGNGAQRDSVAGADTVGAGAAAVVARGFAVMPSVESSAEPSLTERLFVVFLALPADDCLEADLELDRRVLGDCDASEPPDPNPAVAQPRLTFEQLVLGLGWLLRGTSERRAELCYQCFCDGCADGGRTPKTNACGVVAGDEGTVRVERGVRRARFASLLTSVYVMYEPPGPVDETAVARARSEAEQFTAMMYELWGTTHDSVLDADAFDRAAHQHPLLVQAFQLEQLDLPPAAPRPPDYSNPIGAARLRVKNGVYLGLRPGALSNLDDGYFSR